jgi:hypothetical protein
MTPEDEAFPPLEEPFLDAAAVLRQWGFAQGTEPFLERWKARNPWSIPGPLYVGDDDACGVGPVVAPNNVYLEDAPGEFLFRQPSTRYELRQVVEAALANPVSAYACDGNEHWTPEAVVAWWESIQPVRQQLRATKHPSPAVRRWLDYLDHGAETYLRRYMLFLSTGRVPSEG